MPANRPVDPPKPVEVRYRGLWVSGHLVAWRTEHDGWLGYRELQGLRDVQWFHQDDVRDSSACQASGDQAGEQG